MMALFFEYFILSSVISLKEAAADTKYTRKALIEEKRS